MLLWLAIAVFGVLAYTVLLPREGFPSVDVPIAVGSGGYFVDDQVLVDEDVTAPFAEAVLALDEVEGVTSFSRDNSFTVIAELGGETTSVEGSELITQIVADNDFPEQAVFFTSAIDASKFLNEFDLLVGIYGPVGTSGEDLEAAAEIVVAGLEAPEISEAKVDELFEQGINPATGEPVILETSFNQLTDEDGQFRSSIAVGVIAAAEVDSIAIRDATEEALAGLRGDLPDGFEAIVAIDSARIVEQQISSLQSNVLLGIIAAAIVVLLLISWRASVITALFLFTVLAASVGALFLVGITLNTISLFALILALGLFVDDAIVITESVDAFRDDEDDDGDKEAQDLSVIRRAMNRVGAASASGTITTVLVFAPMLLIGGVLGGFIRILPITIILSLTISLILSFVFIPVAARFITLPAPKADGPLVRAEEKVAEMVASLPGARGRKGAAIALGGFLLSFVMTGIGFAVFLPNIGFNIFPPAKDSIALTMEITYEPGTTIEEAKQIALEVNQDAQGVLGDELVQGYLFLGSTSAASVQYDVTPLGGRPTVPEFVDRLTTEVGEQREDARVVFSAVSGGPPAALFPFTMQVFGDDLETVVAAGAVFAEDLEGRVLTLPNGDDFTVLETDLALDDVVARLDGRRYVEVRARFDNDAVTTTTATAQEFFEEMFSLGDFDTDEGATAASALGEVGLESDALGFDFGFESDNQEAFAAVPIAFGVALIAMAVLLIIQFRSSTQWLLVFTAIPFSFFGLFGGLLITNNPLSFFVMLGVLGLIGIAVNNTILLVDFANQERRLGVEMNAAIATAVRRRFRPLIATSLTTVGSLLPLALSDPFWEALAFTIIFGLLSSTFLVLFSFPYYYLALEALRDKVHTPWRRKPKTVASADAGLLTPEDAIL